MEWGKGLYVFVLDALAAIVASTRIVLHGKSLEEIDRQIGGIPIL